MTQERCIDALSITYPAARPAPLHRNDRRITGFLSWPHLIALGVGAIVGTGILTLIGVGAGKAGPAVILSFAIAGLICACAALWPMPKWRR
jgi:APA family basic amino acid/polyamine antiporter